MACIVLAGWFLISEFVEMSLKFLLRGLLLDLTWHLGPPLKLSRRTNLFIHFETIVPNIFFYVWTRLAWGLHLWLLHFCFAFHKILGSYVWFLHSMNFLVTCTCLRVMKLLSISFVWSQMLQPRDRYVIYSHLGTSNVDLCSYTSLKFQNHIEGNVQNLITLPPTFLVSLLIVANRTNG